MSDLIARLSAFAGQLLCLLGWHDEAQVVRHLIGDDERWTYWELLECRRCKRLRDKLQE